MEAILENTSRRVRREGGMGRLKVRELGVFLYLLLSVIR